MARIRQLTRDGEDIVEFFARVMSDPKQNIKYRLQAAQWLADRLWGKAPDVVQIEPGDTLRWLMTATEEELMAVLQEAAAQAALPPPAEEVREQ